MKMFAIAINFLFWTLLRCLTKKPACSFSKNSDLSGGGERHVDLYQMKGKYLKWLLRYYNINWYVVWAECFCRYQKGSTRWHFDLVWAQSAGLFSSSPGKLWKVWVAFKKEHSECYSFQCESVVDHRMDIRPGVSSGVCLFVIWVHVHSPWKVRPMSRLLPVLMSRPLFLPIRFPT